MKHQFVQFLADRPIAAQAQPVIDDLGIRTSPENPIFFSLHINSLAQLVYNVKNIFFTIVFPVISIAA